MYLEVGLKKAGGLDEIVGVHHGHVVEREHVMGVVGPANVDAHEGGATRVLRKAVRNAPADVVQPAVNVGPFRRVCQKMLSSRVCQMVDFRTKNPNLGNFWRVLQWKMLVYFMDSWCILPTSI
jgi:hypothetical protein